MRDKTSTLRSRHRETALTQRCSRFQSSRTSFSSVFSVHRSPAPTRQDPKACFYHNRRKINKSRSVSDAIIVLPDRVSSVAGLRPSSRYESFTRRRAGRLYHRRRFVRTWRFYLAVTIASPPALVPAEEPRTPRAPHKSRIIGRFDLLLVGAAARQDHARLAR